MPNRLRHARTAFAIAFAAAVVTPPTSNAAPLSAADQVEECAYLYPVALARLICYDRITQSITVNRPHPEPFHTLLDIVGSKNRALPPFYADRSWVLEWTVSASLFEVVDVQADGRPNRDLARFVDKGHGISRIFPPGRYALEVRSDGNWRVEVHIPDAPAAVSGSP